MSPGGEAGGAAAEIGSLSYERALEELDGLISRLESGRVDLDEAISCYERGTRLAQHCERLLDRTEQKVTQVVVGGGGEREQPFDPLPAGGSGSPAAASPPAPDPAPPGGFESGRLQRARSVGGALPFGAAGGSRPPAVPVDPDEIPF